MVHEIKVLSIDLHAAGEPCRVIYNQFYDIEGDTMFAKKCYLANEADHIRRALMLEPRGHSNMFGSILTRPVSDNADAGVIFLTNSGYLDMCIHGSICTSRAVVELGLKLKDRDRVVFDTVGGQITARLTYNDQGKVAAVEIENVPSFRYNTTPIEVELEGIGTIEADVVFAGNFFVIVDGDRYSALPTVHTDNYDELATIGMKIKNYVNSHYQIVHPTAPQIRDVSLTVIYNRRAKDPKHVKNVVVFGNRQVDRSPCGTGTSGLMVHFVTRGELELNAPFESESIIGSFFHGRLENIGEDPSGMALYRPKVQGSPSVTARCEFVLESTDIYQYGLPIIF